MTYRKGDVIRFRRGSNEYFGTVVSTLPHSKNLIVKPQDGLGGNQGEWSVRMDSVVRVETPELTEKERTALAALAPRAATVRGLREQGTPVASKTLVDLEARGLVMGLHVGVASVSTIAWGLTEEGRRAARL